MQIPKPFSKVRITFGETMEVPSKLDEEEFEAERVRLEKSLLPDITE